MKISVGGHLRVPLFRRKDRIMSTQNNQHLHNFWLVGVNYKKTDAAVRGMYAVSTEQYEQILALAPKYGIHDLFIISTCNRTELYSFADTAEHLMELLCSVTVGDIETLRSIAYIKNEREAKQHLFQVAAGLDSQILGDFEILGQIKNSVKFAKEKGFIGSIMERIINCVYQSAKSIKTNTQLSGGTVSVSFAAVNYIKEHFTQVDDKKIVLVGTGKIGRATCKNLVDYLGTRQITLINRTEETAKSLAAELHIDWAPYTNLHEQLALADVVLVSTGAMEPVIFSRDLENIGPKLVIDLSVPRNVDAAARNVPGITLVDVDTLSKIKDETLQMRKAEVPKAMAIITDHMAEFMEWYNMRKYIPVMNEVREKLRDIYIAPAFRAVNNIPLEATQEEAIKKIVNTFASKIRRNKAAGCFYIEAINDYIEING